MKFKTVTKGTYKLRNLFSPAWSICIICLHICISAFLILFSVVGHPAVFFDLAIEHKILPDRCIYTVEVYN